MSYREANVNFLVLQQGMEGLEQGIADPALCLFSLFSACSSKKGDYKTATCKICANSAVKSSTKHQVFIYTFGEEGILINLLKTPDWKKSLLIYISPDNI